jgi:hypothetical protein
MEVKEKSKWNCGTVVCGMETKQLRNTKQNKTNSDKQKQQQQTKQQTTKIDFHCELFNIKMNTIILVVSILLCSSIVTGEEQTSNKVKSRTSL